MSTTASPNPPPDWHDGSAGAHLVWHPGIRALDWVLRWSLVALYSAIVWEFLTLHTVNLFSRPERTGALAGSILAGFGIFLALECIFELWWTLTRYMRDQYPRTFATRANLVVSSIFVVLAVPILWCSKWALDIIWRFLHVWANRVPAQVRVSTGAPALGWPAILLLATASIGCSWMFVQGIAPTAKKYRTSLRCLGVRRMLKGTLYMTLFRLRQPRRDFFVQAPVISDMLWWALCAGLHVGLTGTVFAWVLPIPLFGVSLQYALAKAAPPVWLYLGASEFDSFRVFHTLRHEWFWFNGVTLLNRENEAGQATYYIETKHTFEAHPSLSVLRNPHASRLWSLRTRPTLWQQTVTALIDLVRVVVIDVRTGSEPVRYELNWLAEPGRVGKTWLLAREDRAPAFAAVPGGDKGLLFPPERFVTEEMLFRATWTPDGLRMDSVTQPL